MQDWHTYIPDWLTYEFAKDFQSAIVGIVGFGGVIWTQKSNARLTRDQHELERRHGAEALKSSFLTELKMFQSIFKYQAGTPPVQPDDGGHRLVPRIRRDVSVPLMKDIGLLTILGIDVDKILDAIVSIDELDRKLPLISGEVTDQHFAIFNERWPDFRAMVSSMDLKLAPAIQELEGKKGLALAHNANA